jgi:hypothetical protein
MIVKVVDGEGKTSAEARKECNGKTNWPLTSENLKALGIKPNFRVM